MLLSCPAGAQDTAPVPVEPLPPISRAVLQTLALPASDHSATFVLVDLAPNVAVGRHSHPGPVAAYLIYGSLEVVIDGQPAQVFTAGQSFMMPADAIHDERSAAVGTKIVASFVLPPEAPISIPAK
jgi:quercetin dioxygenase-like cupin family protein